MNYELTKYTSEDLKNKVEEKPFSHFVVDDFLDKDLFIKLDRDYRDFYDKNGPNLNSVLSMAKHNPNHKILESNFPITTWGTQLYKSSNGFIDKSFRLMGANVHYNNRTFGYTIDYGGGGKMIDSFGSICNFSETWNSFLKVIYSNEFFEYVFNIFDETPEYKNRIGDKEIKKCNDNKIEDDKKLNYFTGTKINRYMDNYGWYIHSDTSNKVLSFLLYMDNPDWSEGIKGNGTQLWEFGDKDTDFDTNEEFAYNDNSVDFQVRDTRIKGAGKFTPEQKRKIKIYKDVDFKPNRLVGFIKSDNSFCFFWETEVTLEGKILPLSEMYFFSNFIFL